jgi:hypothetical protein
MTMTPMDLLDDAVVIAFQRIQQAYRGSGIRGRARYRHDGRNSQRRE